MTPTRAILTVFSVGFRTEGGVRSTLNKTARLKTISKEANLRKTLNKGIDYKNIA